MLKIDAHQHFWQYNAQKQDWINEEMSAIQRDFMPVDLAPLLQEQGFSGCVSVQADQSLAETGFLLDLAAEHEFIRGVVGWADLRAEDVDTQLAMLSANKKLKGFRHVLQGEADRELMLRHEFSRGISFLEKYDFSYDLLIFPDQIIYATTLADRFPNQRFVIDHLAKPGIRNKEITGWDQDIRALAKRPNVFCKVSGMVTEADWHHWQASDLRPYLDVVFEAFGPERLMFGSDWPVCLVAAAYRQVNAHLEEYTQTLTADEQARFWGINATEFYKL